MQDTLDGIRAQLRHADPDTRPALVALAIALHNALNAHKPGIIGWGVAP